MAVFGCNLPSWMHRRSIGVLLQEGKNSAASAVVRRQSLLEVPTDGSIPLNKFSIF